ncbi:MAG: STAS domain-containing protein, partial [Rhodococcus sp. (in: high G+C Gram-positive bacteria)]
TTAAVVVLVGVEQAVILGIALSIAELVRRQYQPARFVIDRDDSGNARYVQAKLGLQSAPGLLVFRYGADLFYANASRFTTEVEALVAATPDPLHWMVLDCSSINDIDYSAGEALSGLVDYVHAHNIHFALTGLDPALTRVLTEYGVYGKIRPDRIFSSADEVFAAYQQGSADGNQPRI